MSAAVSPAARQMRVAMVFNQCVLDDALLTEPGPVLLGYGEHATFPLGDGQSARGDVTLLSPAEGSSEYHLHLPPDARGAVWLDGQRQEVRALLQATPNVKLGPDDYGVVSLGATSFFFQQVRASAIKSPGAPLLDGDTVASMGLSLFLHVVLLLLMLLAYREMPPSDSLELPADLIARFSITPPPDELLLKQARKSGDETEDPGLRKRDEAGGEKRKDAEGRVGRKDATQDKTEIAGENNGAVVTKVRGVGLLGALAGGNALASALDSPSVSDVLSGLGSLTTTAGRGSGGAGLRGVGKGGGGTADSGLFGAGKLGTGVGAGKGGGGRGKGGPGARGKPRKEAVVSVKTGKPTVNGYLSPEQINRVVRQHQAALRYCYESEVQRQRGLQGRLKVQWRIDRNGKVTTARVAQSTLKNARVEGCVVRQIRKWRFPKPDGGEVQVLYPFIFGVGG